LLAREKSALKPISGFKAGDGLGVVMGCAHADGFKVMTAFLFSCSNATCAVPEAYRELFRGAEDAVASAESWEPGALNLAQAFSMKFRTPLVHGDVTRLLIDLEKQCDERWSRFSLQLPETTRSKLVDRHERPFRAHLAQRIAEDLRRHAAVWHVLVHTSPEIDGRVLLETPSAAPLAESFAAAWRGRLHAAEMDVLHARGMVPNALEAFLSMEFPADQYAQIRLTISQSFFLEGRPWRWETAKKVLLESLTRASAEIESITVPESPVTDPE
jgi:hypothetical protein